MKSPVLNRYHPFMVLKVVTLLAERVTNWNEYPSNIPAIASLRGILVRKPIATHSPILQAYPLKRKSYRWTEARFTTSRTKKQLHTSCTADS